MESQIKQLKLNATNIKSTIFNSNKQLKKIRIQEKNLFGRQQIQRKREQKEAFVESQKTGGGVLGRLGSRLLSGPMSLFDRIKEFFGTVLLGILINNLPMIYDKIKKFLEDNKETIQTIKDVIIGVGNGLIGFVNFIKGISDNIKNIGDQWNQFGKDLDDLLKNNGPLELLTKGLVALDGVFKQEFADLYVQREPEQVRADVKEVVKSAQIPRKTFEKRANEYRSARNSTDITQKVTIPGLGTYQKKRGGIFNMQIVEEATDSYGASIPAQEFDTRFLDVIGNLDSIYQGYSKGGTVRPSSSSSGGSFSGESGTARKARESTQTFSTFERNTEEQSGLLMVQNENNERFEEMIENFKTLRKLSQPKKEGGGGGGGKPPGTPQGTPPPPPPGGKGSIITFDSKQGRDASGEPGVDFSFADIYRNYSIFPGTVVEVGSYYGSGYGRHVTVRSKDSDGKEFDALYAHFGSFAVKEGDTVQAGDYLGSVGWDPVTDTKMSGAGNMTGPHTSVDFYEPNAKPGIVTPAYAGRDKIINLILNSANKDVKSLAPLAPPVSAKPKNGGKKVAKLLQSFDEPESEVLMVMAQQPVVVPGPTRYITRTRTQVMPVAVPIAPKSSGLRELV